MTNNNRLLLISHELTRSGAPLMLFMTAKYLFQCGYSLSVLSPVDGPLRDDYAVAGIQVHITPHILRDARVGARWAERVDGVICNTILSWRSVFAAKAVGVPSYWWIHESNFGLKFALEHPEVADAFSWATKVLFPSKYTASQYLSISEGVNYIVLMSGIEPPVFVTSEKQRFHKSTGEFHLVSVATIEHRKGQDVLLEAVSLLPKSISRHVHLHLIGRKSIDKWFFRKIALRAFLLPRVYLHDELPKPQVLRYVQMADAFVLASRDEALPVSLLEAMALAKPIISTNAGGIGEVIISGHNGLLVDIEDPKGLMKAIQQLYEDPAREELGQKAQQDFYARHTIEVMGNQLCRLFKMTES